MDTFGLSTPAITMGFRLIVYGAIGLIVAITILSRPSRAPNLDAIPTVVGSSAWPGSWWASFRYLTNARAVVQQGYQTYKSAPFKVAEMYRWRVILSSRACVKELARASDDQFSFMEAFDDQIQIRLLLGREICDNPYHNKVLHRQLTRNIKSLYPDIQDEIMASFDEFLNVRGNEWKIVPALSTIEKIVCRMFNRAFVGLPLCRDPEWIDINISYVSDASKGGIAVGLFPEFMRPLAARLLTNVPWNIKRGAKLLGPIIEERQRYMSEYGKEWDDKPNDLISWLMDEADGAELTVERLTNRILVVNLPAIQTSANSFTQALFYLATNPQYVQPLREEVESVVKEDGWSRDALSKMRKVDSFLMECQRIEGLNVVTVSRKALKDYTFSDGTFIPEGTSVAAAALALHHDEKFYENPDKFEPFRFADVHSQDDMGSKYRFVTTTTEYLPFGHGKHACPGRFIAANALKCMLAYTVVSYDVKLDKDGRLPENLRFGSFIAADEYAKIMFRNRVI